MTETVMHSDGSLTYESSVCPDVNGRISVLIPAGRYAFIYGHVTEEGVQNYGYQRSGWASGTDYLVAVEIENGKTTNLDDVS